MSSVSISCITDAKKVGSPAIHVVDSRGSCPANLHVFFERHHESDGNERRRDACLGFGDRDSVDPVFDVVESPRPVALGAVYYRL